MDCTRTFFPSHTESLEPRRMMAFDDWGQAERLARLPDAIDAYASKPLDGAGQTIAIIDSGIDYTHPALGGALGVGNKVVGGHDFVDNDDDPFDTYGHGTEVAGIIAADEYIADGARHRGVAPGAQIVALRIDGDGASSVPDSRIEAALQWVIDHRSEFGITVVNISYGTGHFDEPTASSVYGDEILSLTDAGVSIIAASGNGGLSDGFGIDTPAADPNVVGVGAVDPNDRISDFSERGRTLDLLAPGEFVYTTLRLGGFGVVDGTSFASPYVAGTVALMKSLDSRLKPLDVQSILISSGTLNFDGDTEADPATHLTFPRLDILAALQLTDARIDAPPPEQELFGSFGNGNTLAVDRFGITHFAYYDSLANTMRYSTRSASGVWSKLQTIDDSTPYQGYFLSMAVDQWGRPSVAYFDGTHGDLKYAHFNGIRWTIESVDVKNSTGLYPALIFDRNDLPVIAYYRKTSGDLRVARKDDTGVWRIEAVDTQGDVGRDTSISMDRIGRIGVAYSSSTQGYLKYAIFSPRTGVWGNTVVDNATAGVSFVSTRFGPDNNPVISYYDSRPADLKVARFAARRWKTDRLATRGATGLFTNLMFDDEGTLKILYFDKRQNSVLRAAGNLGNWSFEKLHVNAGRYLACATDTFAGVCRFSYLDSTTGKLTIDQISL